MKYQPEIDGLRAVAVLLVIFYHLDISAFKGGFVGVDVFFVISGYLITGLILEQVAAGRFTVLGFYERRARRILPLLFSMSIVTVLLGYFIFRPYEYPELGESLIGTTLFFSNVQFWLSSGYFDQTSEFNPFLHTWSLAVEEQFYLVYPLLLITLAKSPRKNLIGILLVAALISFGLAVLGGNSHPEAAFYLPHTRFWEFMFGAGLFIFGRSQAVTRGAREGWSILGLGMTIFSGVHFDSSAPYPGWRALVPCAGAAMVIWSTAAGDSLVAKLLRLRLIVGLGLISYSLYMWHWPIIVFYKYLAGRSLTVSDSVGILVFTLFVSVLTWRYIETPFRKRVVFQDSRKLAKLFLFSGLALITFGSTLQLESREVVDGGKARPTISGREFYNPRTCFLESDQSYLEWKLDTCRITHGSEEITLLWGDSYAAHYAPGFTGLAGEISSSIVQYTSSECPPVFGANVSSNKYCVDFNENIERILTEYEVKTVVLAARWERYLDAGEISYPGIKATIERLLSHKVNVVLVGQSPVFPYKDPYYMLNIARNSSREEQSSYRYQIGIREDTNQNLGGISSGAVFINPIQMFCIENLCPIYEDGQFMVIDNGHLTPYASQKYVSRYLALMALRGLDL